MSKAYTHKLNQKLISVMIMINLCFKTALNAIFSAIELDSPAELEKKRICRIVTRDFPQYFAVVSRIKQESNHMGPDGGVLSSSTVPMVQASFPPGALTKRIRVGLQVQEGLLGSAQNSKLMTWVLS